MSAVWPNANIILCDRVLAEKNCMKPMLPKKQLRTALDRKSRIVQASRYVTVRPIEEGKAWYLHSFSRQIEHHNAIWEEDTNLYRHRCTRCSRTLRSLHSVAQTASSSAKYRTRATHEKSQLTLTGFSAKAVLIFADSPLDLIFPSSSTTTQAPS